MKVNAGFGYNVRSAPLTVPRSDSMRRHLVSGNRWRRSSTTGAVSCIGKHRRLVKSSKTTGWKDYISTKNEGYYEFEADGVLTKMLAGLTLPITVASPTGFEPVFWP